MDEEKVAPFSAQVNFGASACERCSSPFTPTPNSAGRFCSANCAYASRREARKTRPCGYCGAPYWTNKWKRNKYCNPKCGVAARTLPRDDPPPPPVVDAVWIPLGRNRFALVDADVAVSVSAHVWHESKGYAARTTPNGTVSLHRQVFGAKDGDAIDHINGNTLDNRGMNLRIATATENNRNSARRGGSSRFKGVHWAAKNGKWHAMIAKAANLGSRYLGSFLVEEDAARAYDSAARSAYGAFACVNFPEEGERSAIA